MPPRAAGGEKGIVRALTFFSPKDLIWPPRSGRGEGESARERRRERRRGEPETARRAAPAPGRSRRSPQVLLAAELCVFWGPCRGARAPGAPGLPPRSNLPRTRGRRRWWAPAAGTPPAAPRSWLELQICLFGGFPRQLKESVSREGISFFLFFVCFFSLFFPLPLSLFFFFLVAAVWLCWGLPPPLASTIHW